jgi:dynein regulatory complex protein 1
MDTHKKELDGLFEGHLKLESQWVEKRDKTEEDNTKAIEELRIKGAKTYADLKINLETEIQNLEKCLEDMKALYQLNQEKLDYNLKVLKEKHEENQHLSDELKRKDQMMTNRLRKLTKDYADVIFFIFFKFLLDFYCFLKDIIFLHFFLIFLFFFLNYMYL